MRLLKIVMRSIHVATWIVSAWVWLNALGLSVVGGLFAFFCTGLLLWVVAIADDALPTWEELRRGKHAGTPVA